MHNIKFFLYDGYFKVQVLLKMTTDSENLICFYCLSFIAL